MGGRGEEVCFVNQGFGALGDEFKFMGKVVGEGDWWDMRGSCRHSACLEVKVKVWVIWKCIEF